MELLHKPLLVNTFWMSISTREFPCVKWSRSSAWCRNQLSGLSTLDSTSQKHTSGSIPTLCKIARWNFDGCMSLIGALFKLTRFKSITSFLLSFMFHSVNTMHGSQVKTANSSAQTSNIATIILQKVTKSCGLTFHENNMYAKADLVDTKQCW